MNNNKINAGCWDNNRFYIGDFPPEEPNYPWTTPPQPYIYPQVPYQSITYHTCGCDIMIKELKETIDRLLKVIESLTNKK
jgi:hypothetical protein